MPLPEEGARFNMLEMHMSKQKTEEGFDLARCAKETEGFSGADIKLLCKEAAMRPVRRLLGKLEKLETDVAGGGVVEESKVKELIESNPITQDDLDNSILVTNKSSGDKFDKMYEAWSKEFGST